MSALKGAEYALAVEGALFSVIQIQIGFKLILLKQRELLNWSNISYSQYLKE